MYWNKVMVNINRIDTKKKYMPIDEEEILWVYLREMLFRMKKGYGLFKTGYHVAYLKELFDLITIEEQFYWNSVYVML